MTNELTHYTQNEIMPAQAASDIELLKLWLHGKPQSTQRQYRYAYELFAAFVAKPLPSVGLMDFQGFVDTLATQSPNSRKRIVAAIKSLFSFGHTIGYLRFNVGAAVKLPKIKNELAQRILTKGQIETMFYVTRNNQRNNLLLRLLYVSGGRISEVCSLTWADVQPNGSTGQVTLFGKGGKTRAVKLPPLTWKALQDFRQGAKSNQPVFLSRQGGKGIDPVQAHRIIKAAAKEAAIDGDVSAHWFRHSHASHALDNGTSIALVRDTLGHNSLETTSKYVHAKPDDSSAMHLE